MTRRRGFTLIELLVVIAIIGILAAMLFPVFARARESARKIQCLSNVKNIAMGVQMYLTDYDAFPPLHKDRNLQEFLMTSSPYKACASCNSKDWPGSNPFLRWPVILDEYIKDREVWNCSSGQLPTLADFIMPEYTGPWWQYYVDTVGQWAAPHDFGGPCRMAFPPGWGGSVTDSIGQQMSAKGDAKTFVQAIHANTMLAGKSTAKIGDPTKWIVAMDSMTGSMSRPTEIMTVGHWCYWYDCDDPAIWDEWYADWNLRKAKAPHMGGLNVGFADGHAKWWTAQAFIEQGSGECTPYRENLNSELKGLCPGAWYEYEGTLDCDSFK